MGLELKNLRSRVTPHHFFYPLKSTFVPHSPLHFYLSPNPFQDTHSFIFFLFIYQQIQQVYLVSGPVLGSLTIQDTHRCSISFYTNESLD